ncbi:MAG: hypothetical protein EOO48_11795 [Flavobacterium sp.]|nr:MAG: hypothetical protein EOO48_11795 [Flavobacterium sp.]
MENTAAIQFNALPRTDSHETNFDFWAAYWNISTSELTEIIAEIGSASFLKIDGYLRMRKASA